MLTLKDRLSRLTYRQACKLLGSVGEKLIRTGGKFDIDILEQVTLDRDLFRVNMGEAMVTIRLAPSNKESGHEGVASSINGDQENPSER